MVGVTGQSAFLALERGAVVGRYLVLARLGQGGMGVVVSAYDPDLDRRVALKLVRGDATAGDAPGAAQARLQAEAQAMARVSHPNVVPVYDVGTAEGRLYVAMEHVQGDLSGWLAAARRPWRAVVEMFRAAGRGLAAAHAAGLVHRDFKPGNVLVGADERPRVSDFGLAAAIAAPGQDRPSSPTLTASGGTPGYMAPEQHAGLRGDARTDQFAFCVSLAEALHGRRPFAGQTVEEYRDNVLAGALLDPPEGCEVPAWLWDVVVKGLATDPSARYPAMHALLAALEADPEAIARRRTTLDALLAFGRGRATAGDVTTADGILRQALAEAAGLADAPRMAMARVGLVEVLAATSGREGEAVAMLAEAEHLLAGASPELDATDRGLLHARVEGARGVLARATRQLDDAAAAFQRAVAGYEATLGEGDVQVARTLADLGLVRAEQHRFVEAVAALERALAIAEAARGATALDVAAVRSSFAGIAAAEGRFEEARVHAEAALAARLRGLGEEHPLVGQEHNNLAVLLHQLGRFAEALDHFERGLAIAERSLGPNDPSTAAGLNNLGNIRHSLGDFAGAREALERALALQEHLRGPTDPEVANVIANLGVVHYDTGALETALACHQRALGILGDAFGPDHPRTANAVANVASILSQMGRVVEARAAYERVIGVLERTVGPRHVDLASALSNLGLTLLQLAPPDTDAAGRALDRAMDIVVGALGPDHPEAGRIAATLGDREAMLGRHSEARAHFERSVAVVSAALGPDHPRLAAALVGLGNACVKSGDPAAAVEPLSRALAIGRAMGSDPVERAAVEVSLAVALWETGERARAIPLAEAAHAVFAAQGEVGAENRDAVAAWIAARR